jgi:glycosyltransferase involved in cell wall biosynthesis
MSDIVFLSDDVVGPRMAGPGIRAWELAKVLARRFSVTLAVPENSPGEEAEAFFRSAPLELVFYNPSRPAEVTALARSARLLVVQGYVLSKFPALKSLPLPIAVDIYDPFVLENLFIHQRKIARLGDRAGVHLRDLRVWNDLLLRGDHFLVASDRQQDLVTGGLLSLNRIGPEALDAGDDLGHLLSVVPFGISEEDGPADPEDVRRAFPAIADGDILLLWGGVLSDWFDPLILLRAFRTARRAEPRLKLLFLSTGHPNPVVPAWEMAREARALAAELGLEGDSVFFHDGWVEYLRRAAYFRRAEVGVSIHRTHFETRSAFRTRMLDYIKHGLPILCTEGDFFAELVERDRLGRVVGSGDEAGLVRAIVELAADPAGRAEMRARLLAARERFLWEKTAAPLVRWAERILAGELRPISRPDREEVVQACAGNGESRVREGLRRMARPLVQKLPLRVRAKLARLLKK